MPINPEDDKRDKLLRFLYELHKKARGIQAIPVGIRELQSAMKKRHEMTQADVSSNLDYLIQVRWVKEVVRERSFKTPGGMELSREQAKYKISDLGINHLEAATVFRTPSAYNQINITNIQGVTVLGDGNVVNAEYTDLSRALDEVERAIAERRDLGDEQKLDATADVATIRTQIAKKRPDQAIIRAAWASLQAIATIDGVAEALEKVGLLIRHLLP